MGSHLYTNKFFGRVVYKRYIEFSTVVGGFYSKFRHWSFAQFYGGTTFIEVRFKNRWLKWMTSILNVLVKFHAFQYHIEKFLSPENWKMLGCQGKKMTRNSLGNLPWQTQMKSFLPYKGFGVEFGTAEKAKQIRPKHGHASLVTWAGRLVPSSNLLCINIYKMSK